MKRAKILITVALLPLASMAQAADVEVDSDVGSCDPECGEIFDIPDNAFFTETDAVHTASEPADPNAQVSPMTWFLGDNRRVTLRQELAYLDFNGETGVETNRSSLRLEWDKLLSSNLYFKFDAKANVYWSSDRRAEQESKSTHTEFPVRELYLQGSIGQISATIGNQVIIWGESEVAAVTDVIAPRNLTDFYFTSLEESRIGQQIARLDYYSDFGHWTYLYIPSPEYDEFPPVEGTYDVEGRRVGDFVISRTEKDLDQEHGLRWKKPIWRGDFSVMVARLTSNQDYLFIDPDGSNSNVRYRDYPQYDFFGSTANLSLGDVALSVELAYKRRMPFQSDDLADGVAQRNVFEAAVSVNYALSPTSSVLLGASNSHIVGDTDELVQEESHRDVNDVGLHWSGSFLHEILTLSYSLNYEFQEHNAVHTASVGYSLSDNLHFNTDFFAFTTDNVEQNPFFNQRSVQFMLNYWF